MRKCQGVECPDIILLDKPLQVHPDLKDAIPAQEPDRSLENETLLRDGKETFEVIGWHDTYHATHLAGIIASRRNGFGLVGVDPDARVIWWNWDDLSNNRPEVATMVDRRQREAEVSGAFQIYMFATSWSTQAFNTHAQLISDDTLSKRFNDERALLVVAAGEADARLNQTPQRIELKTTQAPMNQGDQEYVVVVTGCSPCVAPGAQLLPSANHSPTFVHVAAPAKSVLSTAWGTKDAAGDGTSQATAFVAGLASAMVARYPLLYKDAWQVKQRLQVTSTPIELIGPDAQQGEKLAAGIVDPALATSNPKVERLKAKGAAAQEFENLSWNVDNLRMAFVGGGRRTIPTEDIWRIKTVNGKSVVYVRVAPNGAVRTPNGACTEDWSRHVVDRRSEEADRDARHHGGDARRHRRSPSQVSEASSLSDPDVGTLQRVVGDRDGSRRRRRQSERGAPTVSKRGQARHRVGASRAGATGLRADCRRRLLVPEARAHRRPIHPRALLC